MCFSVIIIKVTELTEEVPEDNKREEVNENGGKLSQEHDGVPGPDGESHHDQLRQDEGGEADGHHVDKLIFKEQKSSKHDDTPLVNGDEYPDEECLVAETPPLSELLVQLWVGDSYLPCDVPVQDQGEDGEHGVHRGVPHHEEPLVEGHTAEVEYSGEYCLRRYT